MERSTRSLWDGRPAASCAYVRWRADCHISKAPYPALGCSARATQFPGTRRWMVCTSNFLNKVRMNQHLYSEYWNQKPHLEGAGFSSSTNSVCKLPFRRGQVVEIGQKPAPEKKPAMLRLLQNHACSQAESTSRKYLRHY